MLIVVFDGLSQCGGQSSVKLFFVYRQLLGVISDFGLLAAALLLGQLVIVVFDGLSRYGERSSVEVFFFVFDQLLESQLRFWFVGSSIDTESSISISIWSSNRLGRINVVVLIARFQLRIVPLAAGQDWWITKPFWSFGFQFILPDSKCRLSRLQLVKSGVSLYHFEACAFKNKLELLYSSAGRCWNWQRWRLWLFS